MLLLHYLIFKNNYAVPNFFLWYALLCNHFHILMISIYDCIYGEEYR